MTGGLQFLFLGTGTSVGVPVIGCDCPVCSSGDPRNNRTRASVVVRAGDTTVLVDSGPDLREQALRENLRRVDAVLYTHAHLDHVSGFDDLRAFCWHREAPLPLHATEGCMRALRGMFGWAFSADQQYRGYVRPDPALIDGPFRCGDLSVEPLPVEHAGVETIGYLFSAAGCPAIAYLPDVKQLPDATASRLAGVPVLVIDALRPKPHPTHLSLDQAVTIARRLGAGSTWLTHLGHENDHRQLESTLPDGIRPAHDGLCLRFDPRP
jgi:phosphoribosyl 1,2-cyclic phosphate phosphodiesterase